MNIRNCRVCGKIYNYVIGPNVCPICKNALDEKFRLVKQYIYDNPGVNISQVSQENEVSIAQIRQWVKEERLEFTKESMSGIACESCGEVIRTGRYCNKCKTEMIHTLGSAYAEKTMQREKEDIKNPKMRFF